MTKGQEEFIDQMTRKLLVEWCDGSVQWGLAEVPLWASIYTDHAVAKKWISVSTNPVQLGQAPLSTIPPNPTGVINARILAAGWETAARFLKR